MKEQISVLGAGQMGTAFANYLSTRGHNVVLWMRDSELCEAMRKTHINERYYPNVKLSDNLKFSTDLSQALEDSNVIVFAIPSSAVKSFLEQYDCELFRSKKFLIISTIKGIPEGERVDRALSFIAASFPQSIVAALSGPNIAREILIGLPTTTCIGCEHQSEYPRLRRMFSSKQLLVEMTNDIAGVELCGSLKNVVTIAVGLVDGLKLGENVKGVVVSQGFTEIKRIITRFGGSSKTLFSPAGLEDLLVASYSGKSRNYRLGVMIGEGRSMKEIEAEFGHITFEGIRTARLTAALSHDLGVFTPLIDSVSSLVQDDKDAYEAFESFWAKLYRKETLE